MGGRGGQEGDGGCRGRGRGDCEEKGGRLLTDRVHLGHVAASPEQPCAHGGEDDRCDKKTAEGKRHSSQGTPWAVAPRPSVLSCPHGPHRRVLCSPETMHETAENFLQYTAAAPTANPRSAPLRAWSLAPPTPTHPFPPPEQTTVSWAKLASPARPSSRASPPFRQARSNSAPGGLEQREQRAVERQRPSSSSHPSPSTPGTLMWYNRPDETAGMHQSDADRPYTPIAQDGARREAAVLPTTRLRGKGCTDHMRHGWGWVGSGRCGPRVQTNSPSLRPSLQQIGWCGGWAARRAIYLSPGVQRTMRC